MTTEALSKIPKVRNGYYYLDAERVYVRLSNILSAIAKPQLIYWAGKQVFEAAADNPALLSDPKNVSQMIYGKRDKAADVGKMIHSWIEAVMKDAPIDASALPEGQRARGEGFLGMVKAHELSLIHQELTVYSDQYQVAGTTDLVAMVTFNGWRGPAVVDFKTGGIYEEAHIQVEAYRRFVNEMIQRGQLRLTHPSLEGDVPYLEHTFLMPLPEDGSASLIHGHGAFEDFLAAHVLYRHLFAPKTKTTGHAPKED